MSSSMLEQAVIDAEALKEAAIKNAEQEVLDKYAGEIKEAVDVLLEQPLEEPFGMEEMPPMGGADEDPFDVGLEDEPADITDKLSMKAVDGEDACACPCPGEDEVIELDLDALMSSAQNMEDEEEDIMFEMSQSELKDLISEQQPSPVQSSVVDHEPEQDISDDGSDDIANTLMDMFSGDDTSIDDEIELDEEILEQAIEEILKVDLENVPRGMIGTTHPTKPEQVYAVEVAAAADEDSTEKESNEAFEEAVKKITNLEEQVKSHKSEKNRLIKEHNELKSIARQVSDKLTELNIANAKLVYQNRILESHSLNERQKEKLVETISNANSTEEAKVIFETLQDSLTSKEKNSPQNLREAVSKNNRLVLKSNRKESQASDSAVDRMKRLAGII